VRVTLQISDRDLYEAVGVPKDRSVTRDEVLTARARLLDYVSGRVRVRNDGVDCPPGVRDLLLADKSDGFFAVTRVDYACRRTAAAVTVDYDLFFDLDPMHQGLARVELPGQPERQHVFRGAARQLRLDRPVTLWDHLRDYLVLGMEHIFTGYDHLSFLLGLMLVAAARGLRRGTSYVLGIVTAFTVAHSVTLLCAGLGLVRLPSRIVEPAIALSIAYVAVENLVVPEPRRRWLLTFGFGLVHGFGFASVLAEIGLPPSGVVPSLVSFNVGVELGQLCVVAAVAPLVLWLVPRLGLSARLRVVGSVVLLLLSTLWFFERVLGRAFFGGRLG
jgi:hydrogenase/urease accessory protein HupE